MHTHGRLRREWPCSQRISQRFEHQWFPRKTNAHEVSHIGLFLGDVPLRNPRGMPPHAWISAPSDVGDGAPNLGARQYTGYDPPGSRGRRPGIVLGETSDTEVGDLHAAVFSEKEVPGPEIAVNDPGRVDDIKDK